MNAFPGFHRSCDLNSKEVKYLVDDVSVCTITWCQALGLSSSGFNIRPSSFRSPSMLQTIIRSTLALGLVWGLGVALAADPKQAAEPVVKKSDAGICHDAKSPSYARTKKFTEFKTLDECLKSGGKLPK
jgi:hypothetical protein